MKIQSQFLFLFCFFSIVIFGFASYAKKPHPFHVGGIECFFQPKTKKIEIVGRFFTDDIEMVLEKTYHKKIILSESNPQIEFYLKDYFLKNIHLKNNSKSLNCDYIGFEIKQESVVVYFETETTGLPKKLEIQVTILHELFDDQTNIIHLKVGKVTKSKKLDYPEHFFSVNF